MKRIAYSFLALLLLVKCGGDDSDETLVLPTNLVVEVTVSNDGSGKVDVTATADNANFYKIYFNETAPENPAKLTSGIATHTYASSGEYTIRVQAHATDVDFTTYTEDITVTLTAEPGITIPAEGYTTPTTYPNMTLVWEDNFEGSSLNTDDWTFETGNGTNGWGNNELEYYRSENTSFQDGHLIITAKKQSYLGRDYTSSRIKTQGKKIFKYGRIDIRAVLPKGQGIWPALWMLGDNIGTTPWPGCGEIDIMELVGGTAEKDRTVYGTLHWDNGGSYACTCDKPGYSLSSGSFNDKFHVFTITWDENFITWYVDDVQFNKIDISPAGLSEFKDEYFFIFNVAVGGNWPGSPTAATVFPQRMIVDYVRVFQKN